MLLLKITPTTTTTRKTNTSTKITVKTQNHLEGNEADDFSQQSRREKLIHRRREPEEPMLYKPVPHPE